jgi:hypothetical protein
VNRSLMTFTSAVFEAFGWSQLLTLMQLRTTNGLLA